MKGKIAILIAATTFSTMRGYAYSHDGHYLVGAIADQMLAGTPTETKIKGLIGSVRLAEAATLADDIKDWDPTGRKHNQPFRVTTDDRLNSDLEQFLHANQTRPDCSGEILHHEYHFSDVQVFTSRPMYADGQVGVNGHDIEHMISLCIDVLTGAQSDTNPQKITRPVALALLVHYLGDIHQPLHVGAEYFDANGTPINPNGAPRFADDEGGNSLALVLPSISETHATHPGNLHHYWDQNAVDTAKINWAGQMGSTTAATANLDAIASFLAQKLPQGWTAEPTIDPAKFAIDCANEILPLAQQAYNALTFSGIAQKASGACFHVTTGTASALPQDDYHALAGSIVADEIHKAGHRLADLLTLILK
jgi:hypothetical protein